MDAARLDCFLAAAQPGVAAAAAEAARGAAPAAVRYSWVREDDGSARLSTGSGRGRRRTIPSELFTVAAAATPGSLHGSSWKASRRLGIYTNRRLNHIIHDRCVPLLHCTLLSTA
jgi:hypothetical protein